MLHHVLEAGLIDPSEIFIDGTHIKAAANNHKYKTVVDQKAKFMSEQLETEINLDRRKHVKKFLKPAKKKARLNLRNNQRRTQTVVSFIRGNIRKYSLIILR